MIGNTTLDNKQYQEDQQRRQQLAEIVQEVLNISTALEMSDEHNSLQRLKETVESETFKVLVLGEFNTGKSTFINALLGQEILPSYATPATAIINEIKWGKESLARLYFHDSDKQPLEIPVTELEEHVVIKDDPEEIRESPYSHIELFWPIDLCRNHVEVIDSPGLNESEVREQVTLNYLRRVDAVVFIVSALRLGPSLNEQETLKMLNEYGHKELFFIVNQFDLLRRTRDREAVKERALEQFSQYTQRQQESAIHFISSLDALDGRLDSDPTRVEESGILALESALNTFLADERSRIKSKRAAMNLQLSISRSQKVIPDKRIYLKTPLEDLRQRYENAQAQFKQLSDDKSNILRRVNSFRRDIRMLIDTKVRDFFREIESDIDIWVEEYDVKLKFELNIEKQVNQVLEEIVDLLDTRVGESFGEWSESVLVPFVETQVERLKSDLEKMAREFESDLRKTRLKLLGTSISAEDLSMSEAGPKNALERVLAAAGGFFLMGLSGAGIGAILGWREVVNALLPQMAVYLAISALGLAPLLPIALIISGSIQGGLSLKRILKRLKEEVSKTYKQKLREGISEQSNKIIQQIEQEVEVLSQRLEQGLQIQIDEIDEQVNSAVKKQEEGQQAVKDKLTEIDEIERDLSDINVRLIEFIASMDNQN